MVAERESGPHLHVSGQHEENVVGTISNFPEEWGFFGQFVGEYTRHKKTLSETVDSLKPVSYLREKYEEVVRTVRL